MVGEEQVGFNEIIVVVVGELKILWENGTEKLFHGPAKAKSSDFIGGLVINKQE